MPTYEYECDDCHTRFERRQHINDAPITTCPDCGGQTRRVIFPVGIIFKGSGFYCTDNRSNGGASRVGSSESTNGKDEKTEAKAEATASEKPAEKPAESKTSEKVATPS